jgi:hypothetical protein
MSQLQSHTEHRGVAGTQHGGHRWMMLACCIPMLLVVVALVLTGVASAGAILYALVCVAMMAVMMAGMGHSSGHN